MITNEILKAIRAIALAKAQEPDYEYSYRKICRWYSREFSTPLEDVLGLDEEHVLQTYFEDTYDRVVNNTDTDEGVEEYETLKADVLGKLEAEQAAQEMADAKWQQDMTEEVMKSEEEAAKAKANKDPNLDKIESINKTFEDTPNFDTE